MTTDLPPAPPVTAWPGDPAYPRRRSSALWLCVRVVYTVAAAAAFVYVCWLMSDSVYPEPRMLSGPVCLFHGQWSWGCDAELGLGMLVVLLPCIFAVGVWRNVATITLSILSCLVWAAIGFWIEVIASI